jgi:lipopolysaccharide export system ATP-binding protein
VVALLGPDGAGKSVCFYTIVGLLAPNAGRVILGGLDVTHLPTYRRAVLGLSYLPQEPSIFRGLTVGENIEAVLEISQHDADLLRQKRDRLLEEFGIGHLRDTPAMALSGGERRRCEIARALAGDPAIILLDEPFAGIDPIAVAEIRKLIGQLAARGVAVLVTDQDLRDLLDVVDRVYVLSGGDVIFCGAPDAMLHDARVRSAYLGDDFPHSIRG